MVGAQHELSTPNRSTTQQWEVTYGSPFCNVISFSRLYWVTWYQQQSKWARILYICCHGRFGQQAPFQYPRQFYKWVGDKNQSIKKQLKEYASRLHDTTLATDSLLARLERLAVGGLLEDLGLAAALLNFTLEVRSSSFSSSFSSTVDVTAPLSASEIFEQGRS